MDALRLMHSTTIGTVPYIGTLTGVIGTMASLGAGSGVSDGGEINGGKGDQGRGKRPTSFGLAADQARKLM
jgi:hypothetical protein